MTCPLISIESKSSSRGVEITVSDNGPGIPDDVMAKIFDPLFTTKSFGTGLGLPAVQKILEQHDGGLEVSSKPGQGATFTVWLPVESSTQDLAAAA
jgi:signal transduction histidine kinase